MPSSRKRITSQDVAERAGVSRATVSYVINKTRPVSDELVKRVEAAIRELHYQPSAVAQSLRDKRTHRIGLVTSNATSPFWAQVIKAVADTCYDQGFHLVLGDSDGNPQRELVHLQNMSSQWVDGIILCTLGEAHREETLQIAQAVPMVLLDSYLKDTPLDSVGCENELGGYLATTHFIEKAGRTKIACLTINVKGNPGADRLVGYQKALMKHDIPLNPDWIKVKEDFSERSAYIDTLELLRSDNPPNAILACSHMKAIGALRAVHELGFGVPEDVALIGYDDMPWAPFLSPSLTVIAQPVMEMATQAVELLVQRIEEHWSDQRDVEAPQKVIFSPQFIDRESCGCRLTGPTEGTVPEF
jgi:DNA-binding LacI/PurR family transcriptional regulator